MNSRFREIGRIGKPRGLEGVIRFLPNDLIDADLLTTGTIVYMKNDRSDLIPARIESVHREEKKNQQTFFVKFDLIANRSDAENAMDRAIFTDQPSPSEITKPEEPDITGYIVKYDDRQIGSVLDSLDSPAHSILEVKFESSTLLIPRVDEYIAEINHDDKTIHCINLDQLIDI